MKQGNVIIIEDFMQNELGLRGAALYIYAVIYSFCKSFGSFYASVEYLAERCRLSRRTVYNALCSLRKGGHIIKLGKHSTYGTVEYGLGNLELGVEKEAAEAEAAEAATAETVEAAEAEKEKKRPEVMPVERETHRGMQNGEAGKNQRAYSSQGLHDTYFDDIQVIDFNKPTLQHELPDYERFSNYYMDPFTLYGEYQAVMLTGRQYDLLEEWIGEYQLSVYISRLEEMILYKPGFRSFSHYKTLKKWIMRDMGV